MEEIIINNSFRNPQKSLTDIETEIEKSVSVDKNNVEINIKYAVSLIDDIAPQIKNLKNNDKDNAARYDYMYDRLAKAVIRLMTNVFNAVDNNFDATNIDNYKQNIQTINKILEKINIADITFDTQEKYLKICEAVGNIIKNTDSYINQKLVNDPTVCFFCGKKTADDKYKVGVDLYKEFDRYQGAIRKEVKFNHTKVFVNCCESCHKIHQSGCTPALLSFLLVEIISIVLFFIITGNPLEFDTFIIGFLIGSVPSFLIGFIINLLISNKTSKHSNIKNSDAVVDHPVVKEYLAKGWTRDKPSPR